MNDHQLLRYSRQILLNDVGFEGQKKLLSAKVIIIGLGGLGSPAALYLAASGIGTLTFVDDDEVEISNLQRQVIHDTESIGLTKVDSAQASASKINPDITIQTINQRLDRIQLASIISKHDLVLDCSDNFQTRFQINEACVNQAKPLVSGAVIQMEGQASTFSNNTDTACYRCLYSEEGEVDDSCSTNGILSPVAGIIGCIQATEAMKVLLGLPTLSGKLLIIDAKQMDFRTIQLRKDPHCPVCSKTAKPLT